MFLPVGVASVGVVDILGHSGHSSQVVAEVDDEIVVVKVGVVSHTGHSVVIGGSVGATTSNM